MARHQHKITCATCGSEACTQQPNTKYCRVCALLSDLKFIATWTKECFICGAEFAPLHRKDAMCGQCDDNRRSYNVDGHCEFCKRDDRVLMRKDIRICMECAKDPAKRGSFIKALQNARQKRTENPVTENCDTPASKAPRAEYNPTI